MTAAPGASGAAVFGDAPTVIGHRGLGCGVVSGHAENTLDSFTTAAALGAPWVEVDVRRTADDVLVVAHDPAYADGVQLVDLSAVQTDDRGTLRLSALLDERAVNAFADLRGRGFDVVVIEIPAEPFVAEPRTPEERLARRIWRLHREATRNRFLRHGIATVRWNPDEPFQHALAEVEAFRRSAMRAPV